MAHLINKDALVAEIEKSKAEALQKKSQCKRHGLEKIMHQISAYNKVLSFIDTLEVKEVDLETSIDDYINSHFTEGCDGGMISDWYKVLGGIHYNDLKEIAKHFFELGLKAQKGEEL